MSAVDIASLTVVTASSVDNQGSCSSNGDCQPVNVLFPNGLPTLEPATRWQSISEPVKGNTPCSDQWLEFDASHRSDSPYALSQIQILYGDLGQMFDGFRNYPPTIEVDYANGIRARLEQNVEFTFTSTNSSQFTNRRLDTFNFYSNTSWNQDIDVFKLVWTLFPYGTYATSLCQMNVEEVHILAFPTASTLPAAAIPNGSSASSSGTASLSVGAIAAIILIPLILIPLIIVFYIRYRNIQRRMNAAKTLLRVQRLDAAVDQADTDTSKLYSRLNNNNESL